MISDLRGVDFASFHIKPTITDETWEWILQSFCDEYNKYRADESHISLEQFKDKVLTSDGFISCANLGFVRVSQGTYYSDSLQPTFNDKTVAVPGRDGSYYFGSNYTEKTWTLQVAYDGMTEMQIRAVSLLFASDTKMWDLYFDERPYKVYHVKIASPVDLSYICFDEKIPGGDCFLSAYLSDKQREESEEIHIFHNHELKPESLSSFKTGKERIYKGEGTLALKCCTPFARQRFKYLEQYDESNVGEWATASRLLPSKEYKKIKPEDVVEGYYDNENGKFYEDGDHTIEIFPLKEKIYVDKDSNPNLAYRWSGSQYLYGVELENINKHFAKQPSSQVSGSTLYFNPEQPGTFRYGAHTAWISGTAFCFVNGHALQVDNVVEYDSWVHGSCITHNAGDMDAHWSELIAYNPTNVTNNDYVNSEAVGLEEDTDYYVFNDQASTMKILTDKANAPKGSSVEDAPYRYYTRSTAKEDHTFPRFEDSQLAIFENRPSDQTISAGDFILVKQVSFDQDFPDSVSNRSGGMEINDNMYVSALTDENGVLSRYWTVFIDEAGNYTYQLRNLRTGAELTSLDENKEYNQNDAVCAYKWVKENGEYYVSLYDVVTTNDPVTHSGLFGNNWDSAIYSDKASADEYKRNWVIDIYKCHEGEDVIFPKGFVLSLDAVPENGKRYYTIKDQDKYYKKVGSSYALIDFKNGNYLIDGNILKEKNASEEYVEVPYYKKESGSYILVDDLTLEELTIYYYKEAPAQYFEFDPQTTDYYVKDGNFYIRSDDSYPQSGVTYYLRVPSSDSYMSFEIIKYPLDNPDGTKNYLRVDKLKTIDGDDYLSINSKNNLIEGVTRDLEKTGNVYNRYKTEGIFFLLNRGESQISIRAIHPDGTRSPINPYVVDPDYIIDDGNLIINASASVVDDELRGPEGWSIYQGNLTVNGDVITDLHSNFRYF